MLNTLILSFLLASVSANPTPSGVHFSAPTRILLRLATDAGEVVLVVPSGRAASVSRTDLPILRLQPTLRESGVLDLAVSVGELDPESPMQPYSVLTLESGKTTHLAVGGYEFDLAWEAMLETPLPNTALSPNSSGASECCVTCGNTKYCGCYVEAPCGTCCEKSCGGCGKGPAGS